VDLGDSCAPHPAGKVLNEPSAANGDGVKSE
jgi:hypothetical protein